MPANFAENIWNLASTHAPALKLWQAWVVVSRARKKKKSATRSVAQQKKARRQEQRREGIVERMKHSNKLQALSFLTECPHAQLITPLVVQLKGTTAHSCQSLFDSLVDRSSGFEGIHAPQDTFCKEPNKGILLHVGRSSDHEQEEVPAAREASSATQTRSRRPLHVSCLFSVFPFV